MYGLAYAKWYGIRMGWNLTAKDSVKLDSSTSSMFWTNRKFNCSEVKYAAMKQRFFCLWSFTKEAGESMYFSQWHPLTLPWQNDSLGVWKSLYHICTCCSALLHNGSHGTCTKTLKKYIGGLSLWQEGYDMVWYHKQLLRNNIGLRMQSNRS